MSSEVQHNNEPVAEVINASENNGNTGVSMDTSDSSKDAAVNVSGDSIEKQVSPLKRDSNAVDAQSKSSKKRKTADRFLEESEALLKSLGVDKIDQSNTRRTRSQSKVGSDTPAKQVNSAPTTPMPSRRSRRSSEKKTTPAKEPEEVTPLKAEAEVSKDEPETTEPAPKETQEETGDKLAKEEKSVAVDDKPTVEEVTVIEEKSVVEEQATVEEALEDKIKVEEAETKAEEAVEEKSEQISLAEITEPAKEETPEASEENVTKAPAEDVKETLVADEPKVESSDSAENSKPEDVKTAVEESKSADAKQEEVKQIPSEKVSECIPSQ